MMCVQSVANISNVPSGAESAQHTIRSIMEKSDKPCKLKCNPRNLLKPPYSQPKIPEMTTETARIVNNYFGNRYRRLESVARDKGWIR